MLSSRGLFVRRDLAASEFLKQLQGYGLPTVKVHYFLPDHPSLIQLFATQQYDVTLKFPVLANFLAFWRREIEGGLHSVQVAHKNLIGPTEWRAVDGVITIN